MTVDTLFLGLHDLILMRLVGTIKVNELLNFILQPLKWNIAHMKFGDCQIEHGVILSYQSDLIEQVEHKEEFDLGFEYNKKKQQFWKKQYW